MRMHAAPLGNEATWDLPEVREGPQLVACQSAGLGVAEEDYVDRRVVTRAVDTERPPRAGLADQPQAYVIVLHHEWWAKLGLTRGEHHRRREAWDRCSGAAEEDLTDAARGGENPDPHARKPRNKVAMLLFAKLRPAHTTVAAPAAAVLTHCEDGETARARASCPAGHIPF